MSTIRVVYTEEPSFPATDQHPNAVRYYVLADNTVVDKVKEGALVRCVVDVLDGPPTIEEVNAVLNPPAAPKMLSDGKLASLLVQQGVLTQAQVDAAVAAVSST